MRTMRTLQVYHWLLDNKMFIAAPAMVVKFGLTGELEHEEILEFLGKYFRNPAYILRQMECEVCTTINFNLAS